MDIQEASPAFKQQQKNNTATPRTTATTTAIITTNAQPQRHYSTQDKLVTND